MAPGYFLAALWGGVLLVALIGYGVLLRRTLFPGEQIGWANQAAWGMAFVVVLGGALNVLYLISRPLVLGLVAAGVGLAISDMKFRRPRFVGALGLLATAIVVAFTAVHYLQSVAAPSPALHDDVRGYYAFPKQMLESGGIAPDPFNAYRLGTGLAGQAALHTLVLALFDFRNLFLVEGVATVICVGLLFHVAERKKLGWFWRAVLAIFFLGFPPNDPPLRINSSSFTTGMVVFLALFEFLDRDELHDEMPGRNASIVALLSASAFALKTNLIPFCVVILVLSYLVYLVRTGFERRGVLEAALVPPLALAMLWPWMVALKRSSGTLLNPILGRGFDEYSYGHYLEEGFAGGLTFAQKLSTIQQRFFSRDIYFSLVVLTAFALVFAKLRRRGASHAFALGSLAAALLILLTADLSNIGPFFRYLFVGVFVSLLLLSAELLDGSSRRFEAGPPALAWRRAVAFAPVAATAAALLSCAVGGRSGFATTGRWVSDIVREMRSDRPIFPESEREAYRKAQQSVPSGEAILSRDNHTLLFDSARNRVYNVNDPGACSPPPGMPYFQGPEAVASYLLEHRIRYVAYEYANQAGYPVADNLWRHKPERPYLHRVLERAKVALDRVLGELGASRLRVYDDGRRFVLDLQRPAEKPAAYREPNYFQMAKILVLAWARTDGFDAYKVWTDGHGAIDDIHYDRDPGDSLLVLNTFGYHTWNGDMKRLRLTVSVNGRPLPFVRHDCNAYFFSLAAVDGPITRIAIDSSTFVPREEKVRLGMAGDDKALGIDVDTIEVR